MKYFLSLSILVLSTLNVSAQNHVNVEKTIEDLSLWSKNVITLDSDTNCSSFILRVEEKVPPHYHEYHTETLYVISGTANLLLGDSLYKIKQGDYIHIPPKTVHSVKVTSMQWLEVISLQAPEFDGTDRIWVDDDVK